MSPEAMNARVLGRRVFYGGDGLNDRVDPFADAMFVAGMLFAAKVCRDEGKRCHSDAGLHYADAIESHAKGEG